MRKLRELVLEKNLEYNYRGEAMRDYMVGVITAKELMDVAKDLFHTDTTTKKEMEGILNNPFLQDSVAKQYSIDTKTLIRRVEELLKEL